MIIVKLLDIDAYLLLVGDVVSLKNSLLVPCTTRLRCLEECFIYIKSIYVKTETGVMINSEATLIGEHLADKYLAVNYRIQKSLVNTK